MANPNTNQQVGTKLVTQLPPEFEGYVVVGGTWKPVDLLKDDPTMNEREVVFNHTFYGPGTRVNCQLVQKLTTPATPLLAKSQVIPEKATDDNPAPGRWLVMKADPVSFGSRKQVFDVILERNDDEDLTITTPA